MDEPTTDAESDAAPRPPLAIRVGVTGAIELTGERLETLRPAVADILAFIKDETLRLAADSRARAVYASDAPALRFISPLAVGADRLAAEEALKAGYSLFAPLPFPQEDYEEDFPSGLRQPN